jgi:hypothetical protein
MENARYATNDETYRPKIELSCVVVWKV